MASSKTRQRKMARAKMERQLVRRAAKARRRRQVQAGVAVGVAVLVLVFGALWFGGAFEPDKPKTVADDCAWTPGGSSSTIGTPPTTGIAKTGTEVLTIGTDQGNITAAVDLAKTPCTAASLTYLGSKDFYSKTSCTRLTTAGSFVLKCGEPTDGSGGPGYTSIDENIQPATEPTASPSASTDPSASPSASATATALYPRGSVVMAQTAGPNSNGSQFFIVYQDSRLPAGMTVVGTVTQGLDIVEKVAAGGVAAGGSSATDGQPNTKISITTLTLAPEGAAPSNPATPSPSVSAAPSDSTSPSASPSASS